MDNNPYASPQEVNSAPARAKQGIRLAAVVRDVAFIFILTGVGGFIVGFMSLGTPAESPQFMLALIAANFVMSIVGFTLSGVWARDGRWAHLALVALGVWFGSLVNLLFGISIGQWVASGIFILVLMGIGGGLSYFFAPVTPGME